MISAGRKHGDGGQNMSRITCLGMEALPFAVFVLFLCTTGISYKMKDAIGYFKQICSYFGVILPNRGVKVLADQSANRARHDSVVDMFIHFEF